MTQVARLRLAVLGTVGGGKSTLLNLLCGRELLPTGVQATTMRSIQILPAPLREQTCLMHGGPQPAEIIVYSDLEGRAYLKELMAQNGSASPGSASPVRLQLPFSFRLARRLIGSDAATNAVDFRASLCLLDLPGFQYLENEHNWNLIAAEIQNALCLLIFNAEEVNSHLEDEMLRRLFLHLKQTGKSWRQVFFVLNRVDAYRRDINAADAQARRIAQLRRLIHQNAETVFQEQLALTQPEIYPVSLLPLLIVEMLRWPSQGQDAHERTVLQNRVGLLARQWLPDDALERLPAPAQWTRQDIAQVHADLFACCGGKTLFPALRGYLQQHALRK
jgi:GTPase SAR1 family protein